MKFQVVLLATALWSISSQALEQKCKQEGCPVRIVVSKADQTMTVQTESTSETWAVSTGAPERSTPNMEWNPDGRMYKQFFNSVGGFPLRYTIFIRGPFAIYGVPQNSFEERQLGKPVSRGGIRLKMIHAEKLFGIVRSYGPNNVWVSVQ